MSLKFNGNITIDEVFSQNKSIIYDNVLKKIGESHLDQSVTEVKVITITINKVEYSITLGRDKFIASLENAISFYESVEEYEKCQECLNIISDIKLKKY